MSQKVFLYCRVSTDRQAKHGDSIEDQTQALHEWASAHECVIIGEYVDAGFSGAKDYTTRPEFCRMLADADRLRPDLLLFTRLDRFTRNPRDYYNVAHIFEKHGLQWKAIWQDFDSTTPQGQAMIGTMVVFSKLERDNVSSRIKAHNAEKRKRGELCSGNMPRGYQIQDKKPVKDPATEAGVSAFWRTYLSGQGLSSAIHAADYHGVHIGVSSASYMLRNAASYAGTIQGVPCDPYLTEAEAAQILSKRKKPIRKTGRTYLFSGFAYCAECGRHLGAHASKLKTGSYIYYNCSGHYRDPDSCSNTVNIYERDIEAQLIDRLEDGLLSLLEEAKKAQTDPQIAENMRRRISALETQKSRLLDVYLDGTITKEEFESRRESIDAEFENLKNNLRQIEKTKKPEELRELLPENWKEIYEGLDREHRRAFWYGMLREIQVSSDRSVSFITQI